MSAGRAIFLPTLALLLGGCGDARERATRALQRVTPAVLRSDLAKYYKNTFAEHRKTVVTLNPDYYSESLRALRPHHVSAYPDGFAICLEVAGDIETGLYVVPAGMEVEPAATRSASFEKLGDGVYWYSFRP